MNARQLHERLIFAAQVIEALQLEICAVRDRSVLPSASIAKMVRRTCDDLASAAQNVALATSLVRAFIERRNGEDRRDGLTGPEHPT